VRFSLPTGDAEATPGATLAECRAALGDLLGPAAAGPLVADGVPLADAQVAGIAPWRPGSHVAPAPSAGSAAEPTASPGSAAERAAHAPWHLAVVTGPDAGAVAAPGPGGLLVGRSPAADLRLTDRAVSRRHLTLSGRLVARDTSANGTRVLRRGRWRRVRRRRVRVGARLRVGDTVLEVRRAADLRAGPDPEPAPAPSDAGTRAATLAVPVVTGVALAAATRSAVFLAVALAGPVATAAPAAVRRLRERRRRRRPAHDDLGPDAAAASVLLASGQAAGPPVWWPLALAGLAVVGPAEQRRAVARALVGAALLDREVQLSLLAEDPAPWSWARWLAGRLGGEATARVAARVAACPGALDVPGPHLVVADGPGPWRSALERWWLRRDERCAVVVLADEAPPWCSWVLDASAGVLRGPGGRRTVEAPVAGPAWAETHARRVAARDAALAAAAEDLPALVSPADVGLPADAATVAAAWSSSEPGLRVPLGLAAAPGGVVPAWVDLVEDGPHALVAGTTGAGKSEMLQALVLGLALRHPPAELALVLLDFKGGAGLRPCRALPHVVGAVSDLDPQAAVRALEALGAELRRREAVLDAVGATDVAQLRGTPHALPRLLVVVDEFRALAEDLPDFVPALVRLAAQGRSLGMHLVLATQRPGGAVTAQMRANLALRVCLRVTEPADSADVVDVPDAAAIPAHLPGRAIVRGANGRPRLVQCVWPALAPAPTPPVRRALPWAAFGTGVAGPAPAEGHAERLARVAAAAWGARPEPLWSPPLPERVTDVPPLADGALVLGLTDPPGARGRGLLTWPGRGALVVAGRGRSGRTTAALRAATAALAAGREVHAVGLPDGALAAHPCLGTVVGLDDPRRLARLLALLTDRPPTAPPALLVVDDAAAADEALTGLPRGAGDGLLERVARAAGRCALGVVLTGHPRDVQRYLPLAAARLALPVADPVDDAALGVPRELGGRSVPGRGVWQGATRCHVALPLAQPLPVPPDGAPAPSPLRLVPLPERVSLATLAPAPPGRLVLGVGGDDGAPVAVDARPGVLVVGPAGAGRSTALAVLTAGSARSAPADVLVVAADGPLAADPRVARSGRDALAALRGRPPAAVVVDDLDVVARASPELDDLLADWVLAAEAGDASAPAVLAACRTDRAATAYRGVLAALRQCATVVLLAPAEPGSADVAGVDLAAATDPVRPRHPGRGVVVVRGAVTPVQVALP
jgi:S-DNA-T family DNA segregation ATPase FtsK/SpoIIIE